MATSLGTNTVVVTRVHCICWAHILKGTFSRVAAPFRKKTQKKDPDQAARIKGLSGPLMPTHARMKLPRKSHNHDYMQRIRDEEQTIATSPFILMEHKITNTCTCSFRVGFSTSSLRQYKKKHKKYHKTSIKDGQQ